MHCREVHAKSGEWKGSGGGMLDKFVARPFGQEVARRCSMRHLGDLPPGTKLVVIFGLGNGGNYVREARKHCAFEIGTQVRQNGLAEEAMSLFVTSQNTHSVLEHDEKTGAFIKVAASGLGDPIGVVVGLDGNLLVSDGQGNEVNRLTKLTARSSTCLHQLIWLLQWA